jgi:hypothetical protein
MTTLSDFVFLIVVVWLFMHELDAIQQREWRFFFSPFGISDTQAYQLFVIAHVPLFAFILWYMPSMTFQVGFDVFCIVHAAVHFALRNHAHVDFNNVFSAVWIYGAVPLAVLHLILIAAT